MLTPDEIQAIKAWIEEHKRSKAHLYSIGALHAGKAELENFMTEAVVRRVLERLLQEN